MSMIGRLNAYMCIRCRSVIVTEQIDEGVTPITIRCRANVECGGEMMSRFYRLPENAPPVSHEWYKPGMDEYKGMSRALQEHVQKNGCLLRKRVTK